MTRPISLLVSRVNVVVDRIRAIKAITDEDVARLPLRHDLPRLLRRINLLRRAVALAIEGKISQAAFDLCTEGAAGKKPGMPRHPSASSPAITTAFPELPECPRRHCPGSSCQKDQRKHWPTCPEPS